MALFQGVRINEVCCVSMEGHPLSPRWSLSIRNHSPTGFEWGYQGSGPAQLALAILLEVTDVKEAQRAYQDFKRTVVAAWQEDRWAATTEAIHDWLVKWRLLHPIQVCEVEEANDE